MRLGGQDPQPVGPCAGTDVRPAVGGGPGYAPGVFHMIRVGLEGVAPGGLSGRTRPSSRPRSRAVSLERVDLAFW